MMRIIILTFLVFMFFNDLFGQTNCGSVLPYGNNEKAGQYASVNGIKMYYEVYGSSTNPALLLIHGNGSSIEGTACQIDFFSDRYYVIAADNRFHGKSENGDEELTYRLMAEDFNALLDFLNIDSACILGQSDGGIIALIMGMKYPEKVFKIVATSPNIRTDSTAIWQWDLLNVRNYTNELKQKIEDGDQSFETMRSYAQMNLINKYPKIKNSELNKINAPTMIVAGDDDVIKLDHVFEIYQSITNAHLFIMPGATHIMFSLQPDFFNEVVGRFLDKPFTRPSTREIFEGG